jgi:hypothetical protein
MLWESCSSGYTERHKIEFAIFGFFCDFIRILQVAAKSTQGVRKLFARRPLDSFPPSQIYPRIAQNTLEVSGASQCGPRAKGWRGRPESGDLAGGLGRGSGWGGSRVHEGSVWVPTCGREGTGHPGRRSRAVGAAGRERPGGRWMTAPQ